MTSLILDHVARDYLYLGINTGEEDMFLELSKDMIMIVLEFSLDRSRLIAHLAVLHF
jgi:hypothetical protein